MVVVFFADLHRGDEVLLDVMRHLLRAQDLQPIEQPYMLLTTYQQDPNNYMPACIDLVLDQLNRRQVRKTKIHLEPIEREICAERLQTRLQAEPDVVNTLLADGCASWLIEKRLERCVREGCLLLDNVTNTWDFTTRRVTRQTPDELCGLDHLSANDLEFLRIFACLGMTTTRTILEKARASDDLDAKLASAVENEFLVAPMDATTTTTTRAGEYCFAHEALRDLIYQGIPDEDRPKFHYQIAENLWLSFDMQELDDMIVLVVENLLLGRPCLPDKKRRAAVARLCLRCGELRAQVSAYNSAFFFFSSAIELISDGWEDEYELCLGLHCAACEVANCLAFSEQLYRLAETTFEKCRSFQDALRVHISKLYMIGAQGDCSKGIAYGASLLSQLGEHIPLEPRRRHAYQFYCRTHRRLKNIATTEQVLRLPSMVNAEKIAAMRILNALLPYIFNAKFYLMPLVVDKMIELTLEYGTSALSGIAFAMLGCMQCW